MKTIEEILAFIKEFEKTSLTSIEIEMADLKLKLTKAASATDQNSAKCETRAMEPKAGCEGFVVKSPLVGTFYAASSPAAKPFVAVGDIVKKGDVLCIIEAMKTMNEIKAPISGRILKVLAKNGEAVGFDQALLAIEHDA